MGVYMGVEDPSGHSCGSDAHIKSDNARQEGLQRLQACVDSSGGIGSGAAAGQKFGNSFLDEYLCTSHESRQKETSQTERDLPGSADYLQQACHLEKDSVMQSG